MQTYRDVHPCIPYFVHTCVFFLDTPPSTMHTAAIRDDGGRKKTAGGPITELTAREHIRLCLPALAATNENRHLSVILSPWYRTRAKTVTA